MNTLVTETCETNTFEAYNVADFLVDKLNKQKIHNPTPIQQASIPLVLKNRDILGSAETGSGKTLAFALPIIHKLHEDPNGKAVIIAPTRELAEQIFNNMQRLVPNRMSIALLIGGASIHKQLQQLRRLPQIIIGTPGRMIDHLERGKLHLTDTSILVLDETDRMLDMGFTDQINELVEQMPESRQTLLFSATMPKAIVHTANKFLDNPERIKIGEATKPSDNINQEFKNVDTKHKLSVTLSEVNEREGSIIIFVRTKLGADKLCYQLQKEKIKADTIHGDLRHGKRQRVIRAFHQKRFRVLVATDVAARGLDIPHVEHVINYDLPQSPEDYVHRIGRTGRGGSKGESLCIVAPSDQHKLRAIQRFISGKEDSSEPRRKPGKKPFKHGGKFSSRQKGSDRGKFADRKKSFKDRSKNSDSRSRDSDSRSRSKDSRSRDSGSRSRNSDSRFKDSDSRSRSKDSRPKKVVKRNRSNERTERS